MSLLCWIVAIGGTVILLWKVAYSRGLPVVRHPLLDAIRDGRADRVREMLAEGADPNAADKWISNGWLLRFDPVQLQSFAPTAAMVAAELGRIDILEILADAGADLNRTAGNGNTALLEAMLSHSSETVRFLLDRGVPANERDWAGETAIFHAATESADMVRMLIQAGADPAVQSSAGDTALMFAAGEGLDDIVSLLLENGADPVARNQDGNTAQDLARAAGHASTVAILTQAAGREEQATLLLESMR